MSSALELEDSVLEDSVLEDSVLDDPVLLDSVRVELSLSVSPRPGTPGRGVGGEGFFKIPT